jgi:hypothetical protein
MLSLPSLGMHAAVAPVYHRGALHYEAADLAISQTRMMAPE